MRQAELFAVKPSRQSEIIGPGALLLSGFASGVAPRLLHAIEAIANVAPFRHMETPGGKRMSVAMTNCGALGWISDRRGYRYSATDPGTARPWPPMPQVICELAVAAAAKAGYPAFEPDACLVNRYEPGARLTSHQDRNERDFAQPIVSVSLGLPCSFFFGGARRRDPITRIPLSHGDVVVWGGPSRLSHHGVLPLKAGDHATTGACRLNLTLRRAG